MLFGFFFAAGGGQKPVKKAAFAGMFYDADPERLSRTIESYLVSGREAAIEGNIVGLIAPHAGYVYSGATAGRAYALVRGRNYRTVVIIGPSHRLGFSGCSIWPEGYFDTPLGRVEVDQDVARVIMKESGFPFVEEAFNEEHSVEVQIPFVQKVLPAAKIVPIVMGFQEERTITRLASALSKACRPGEALIVASTDLSHYLPKKEAEKADADTMAIISKLDTATIIRKTEAGDNFMCGGGPVAAALLYAKKIGQAAVTILARADSSAAGGPVVGYLAAAVSAGGPKKSQEKFSFTLSGEEQKLLLHNARQAIASYLETGQILADGSGRPAFKTPLGVFVTLKKKGNLRGCIGLPEPVLPLGLAVIQAAIHAATKDPRFPPVKTEELNSIAIEISVLSPMRRISDPKTVKVGSHGLLIKKSGRSGLLLPQVAVENGWDRMTFLEQICLKAGLPPDAWRTGAELYVFESFIFGD